MAEFTTENLRAIKARVSRKIFLRDGDPKVEITVHLGKCGMAAGAREVMEALLSLAAESDREDIFVLSRGCLGKCETEPNVTVEILGEPPVLYHKMTPERMAAVFQKHVIEGKVQTALTKT